MTTRPTNPDVIGANHLLHCPKCWGMRQHIRRVNKITRTETYECQVCGHVQCYELPQAVQV